MVVEEGKGIWRQLVRVIARKGGQLPVNRPYRPFFAGPAMNIAQSKRELVTDYSISDVH